MRFLIDAQLPPRLAEWLRAKGHDSEHVGEIIGLKATDRDIIERAAAQNLVIVTKDADFQGLIEKPPPQIIWVRLGNVTNRVLFARMEADWAGTLKALEARQPIVEVA